MAPTEHAGQGYMSRSFGESYRAFGDIVHLPRTGLHLLKRPIRGPLYDLIGVYPYSMSADWSGLNHDIDDLRQGGAVSVVFVADPFQSETVGSLTKDWALSRHFKTHYVVDLRQDWRGNRRKQERRITRRALEALRLDVLSDPVPLAPALWELYQTTIDRKQVTGMQRLSLDTIERQLAIPGAVVITAQDETGLAGASLSFDHGQTSACHIMFLSEESRRSHTSHALIYVSLAELQKRGCSFTNLGGPAGNDDDPSDGLARYKYRWTRETCSAVICGSILDPVAYRDLEAEAGTGSTGFFPSYRAFGGFS